MCLFQDDVPQLDDQEDLPPPETDDEYVDQVQTPTLWFGTFRGPHVMVALTGPLSILSHGNPHRVIEPLNHLIRWDPVPVFAFPNTLPCKGNGSFLPHGMRDPCNHVNWHVQPCELSQKAVWRVMQQEQHTTEATHHTQKQQKQHTMQRCIQSHRRDWGEGSIAIFFHLGYSTSVVGDRHKVHKCTPRPRYSELTKPQQKRADKQAYVLRRQKIV